MSRIAGVVSKNHERTRALTEMLERVWPDGSGGMETAVLGEAAFGWSGSGAPHLAAADDAVAVFDGAVYNRREFSVAGNNAGLLIQLYRDHGFLQALRLLNADFACALYDRAAGVLWLGRDRFGVKPLYYAAGDGSFAFASRPRALLALSGVSREVNRQFVALFAGSHYRVIDNDPASSPYHGISQLPAAHILSVENGAIAIQRYWSLEEAPDFAASEEELADRYRALLMDAVTIRLRASQRPAFTLSGGLDSSSVLACASRAAGETQDAVSALYTDATYDESREIQDMVGKYVRQWHTVRIDEPDIPDLLMQMIAAHDEPVATATWLSHWLLGREVCDRGYRSLFGGLGGDELNAGEYEYFPFFFADLKASGRDQELDREVQAWIQHHDHPIFSKSQEVAADAMARLVDLSHPGLCRPDTRRLHRYASALNPDFFRLADFTPVMEHPFTSYLKNRAYQDLTRETLPCCLRAVDRHGQAFGLDHLHPFLDHRLVEFMFRVPGAFKIREGITKRLLRTAMQGILPEATRTRVKKTGWNAPAHLWFAGRGREMLLELVHSQSFRERGIYNISEVLGIIDEHERIVSRGLPEENHMMFLWQLVNLELWFEWLERLPNPVEASRPPAPNAAF